MGEAQHAHERQSCFPDALYSARLLWKVLSQTKVIVSVLKADRVVRRKVSVRTRTKTRTREWVENGGEYGCRDEKGKERGAFGLERTKSKTRRKVKTSCYLCKLHHDNFSKSTIELPWPSYPSTTSLNPSLNSESQESLTFLPITRSQPPCPPRRSTSLPYYKILNQLKRVQIVTGPHYALPDFRLEVDDGYAFSHLVESYMSGDTDMRDPIWKPLLQASHEEAGVRNLILAVASINRARSFRCLLSDHPNLERAVPRHCFQARVRLSSLLSRCKIRADAQAWEVSFMAIYLLTYLSALLSDKTAVRYWARTVVKVLGRALRVFGDEIEGDGFKLPGGMREVAFAFGRLNLSL
ncbi:uncharacterized protein PAC_01505 [Phialocephala subalpina]|uniref:Uncharacterized protein n=1 Tax=Phialocephala subalpina TaxID=576137 RepID=A0A1L7WFU7_9HELO|nr:uncharacterized protein PAC_01505 [Phialocephala subalpina]